MKHIKTYENDDEMIDIVSYPEGYIIEVTEEELDHLRDRFDISWDEEVELKHNHFGQWGAFEEDVDLMEEWVKFFRLVGDAEEVDNNIEMYRETGKFNL